MENSNIIFFSSFMFYKVSFLNSDINENEKKIQYVQDQVSQVKV